MTRLRIAAVVLLAVSLALAGKLVKIQTIDADELVEKGLAGRNGHQVLPAARGSILDRNGEELAISIDRPQLVADPTIVEDPLAGARMLAPLLGQTEVEIQRQLTREDDRFVELVRAPDEEQYAALAAALEADPVAGLFWYEVPTRVRPSGDLGLSVLGRVDASGVEHGGLEAEYDETLTGEDGERTYERGAGNATIAVGEIVVVAPEPGDDLVLTIDRTLQYQTEKLLGEALEESGAEHGMVIVSEPSTGEILALANLSLDDEGNAAQPSRNYALQDRYELGSVMKAFTVAAAIEEGLVNADTLFEVPDELAVGSSTFSDSHRHDPKTWPVSEIFGRSSNTGTIKIAQLLGEQRAADWLRAFGFGEPIGIDFPEATSGLVTPVEDWSESTLATVSIGSGGVDESAAQVLAGYNALANDGELVPLSLVASVVDADGNEQSMRTESRQVVSSATATQMRGLLRGVVAEGTGTRAAVEGFEVAGKTGTARKRNDDGSYAEDRHRVSFAGFAPAGRPELSAIVMLDEPDPNKVDVSGGSVAAPLFADVMRFALRHNNVPPSLTATLASTDVDGLEQPSELLRVTPAGEERVAPAAGSEGDGAPDDDSDAEGDSEPEPDVEPVQGLDG